MQLYSDLGREIQERAFLHWISQLQEVIEEIFHEVRRDSEYRYDDTPIFWHRSGLTRHEWDIFTSPQAIRANLLAAYEEALGRVELATTGVAEAMETQKPPEVPTEALNPLMASIFQFRCTRLTRTQDPRKNSLMRRIDCCSTPYLFFCRRAWSAEWPSTWAPRTMITRITIARAFLQ